MLYFHQFVIHLLSFLSIVSALRCHSEGGRESSLSLSDCKSAARDLRNSCPQGVSLAAERAFKYGKMQLTTGDIPFELPITAWRGNCVIVISHYDMKKEVITSVSQILLSVEDILEGCVRKQGEGGQEGVDGVIINVSRLHPPNPRPGTSLASIMGDLIREKRQKSPPNLNRLNKVAEEKR
jgi:hypothetical protein